MNKKLFFVAVLLLFAAAVMANFSAQAAGKSSLLTQATSSRVIAFTFHKITKTAPDFDRAIRNLKSFKDGNQAVQSSLLTTERARYQIEYAALDPLKTVIVARSAVVLKTDLNGPTLKVEFNKGATGAVYFPYQWADQNFALIPDQFDKFLSIPMSINEMSSAAARLGPGGSATMVVEMLPLSADATAPMMLDNVQQWLLMTRVVAVTFYNGYLETIWSWQAPDYTRPGYSPIQVLKK